MSCQVMQWTKAEPEVVYDLLMDVERWSDWVPMVTTASWEQPGEPDTALRGVRRVRNGISVTLDKITGGRNRIITPTHQRFRVVFP